MAATGYSRSEMPGSGAAQVRLLDGCAPQVLRAKPAFRARRVAAQLDVGALAQLGERLICIQEVRSSILLGSTKQAAGRGGWPCVSGQSDLIIEPSVEGWIIQSDDPHCAQAQRIDIVKREINNTVRCTGVAVHPDRWSEPDRVVQVKYTNQVRSYDRTTTPRFWRGRESDASDPVETKPRANQPGPGRYVCLSLDRIKREKGVW